jgi:hypothetical protein
MKLSQPVRRGVLTAHITFSVGLLGDSAGFLAVAIRGATTHDAELARSSWELLNMFSMLFGIPLSFAALLTGLTLGLGTKWGVLRYQWVTIKLLLIISVMVVGGLVISPASEAMRAGIGGGEDNLIGAAIYDVLALLTATTLSVYKPGRGWRRTPRASARQLERV